MISLNLVYSSDGKGTVTKIIKFRKLISKLTTDDTIYTMYEVM